MVSIDNGKKGSSLQPAGEAVRVPVTGPDAGESTEVPVVYHASGRFAPLTTSREPESLGSASIGNRNAEATTTAGPTLTFTVSGGSTVTISQTAPSTGAQRTGGDSVAVTATFSSN